MVNKTNQNVTFKGSKTKIMGEPIREGQTLPNFKLTGVDLSDIDNTQFKGQALLISVVPSVDTPVCSVQTKRFNQELQKSGGTLSVLTVSMDLPFAQKRWCAAEGVSNITLGSDYKYRNFGESFGAYIPDVGLLTRAIFVADKNGKVTYVEYVPEVTSEPDYDTAMAKAMEAAK